MNGWNLIWAMIAAVVSGTAAAMGIGGGMILMLYLTLILHMDQLTAQGMNLLFFLPIAALALILHSKNKLVAWKTVLPSILSGIAGAFLGSWAAGAIGSPGLRKLFAVFLLITGLRELFCKIKQPDNPAKNEAQQ